MKVLIIEDEKHTAKGLARMLTEIDKEFEVVEFIDSVEDAIDFFQASKEIDLLFMDIQLSDGKCFDIFKEVEISTPIIFTTSFNEYAIKAFEVNSIDYLLKPIQPEALEKSINKFKKIFKPSDEQNINLHALLKHLKQPEKELKSRFLVKSGNTMQSVPVAEIAYFYIDNQLTFLQTFENKRHMINFTIENLEKQVSQTDFFRINRQFIVNINAIKTVHNYFNGALKIDLIPATEKEVIVSRHTANEFKEWLDR